MINTQKGKERDLLFWTVPRWWILLCMYLYFHYFVRLTNESMTIDQLYTVYSQCTRVHCTLYSEHSVNLRTSTAPPNSMYFAYNVYFVH